MPRRSPRIAALIGLVVFASSACDAPAERPSSGVTVEDSAGIRIVTHEAGPVLDTVALEPVLSIGREGDPDYEFFGIRQVSPLGSGNVVVANGGTSELMFYGPDGKYLRRVGRQGEGPSEFGFLTTVYTRAADTLTVMDPRRRRLVHFDSGGTFVRGESFAEDLTTASPTSTCFFPGLMGLLADGTRLTRGWGCMELTGSDGVRPTMMTLVLAHGERRDTIGRFNSNDVWERSSGRGADAVDLIPFAHVMGWATRGNRVVFSDGLDFSLRVYDSTATLVEIYRENAVPPEVTPEDRDLYVEERAAADRPHPDDVPFPDRFGAYRQLLVSHEGEIWAQWAERPSESTTRWTVYGSDGQTVRRLVLPKIRIHAVRDGRIYGHTEDELGIQTVLALEDPGS